MIRVQQFTEFTQIANELLALYREGCELKQTYPLLRRWQEILKAMPLEARKSQPWIVCDMPPGCSQSYVVETTHPTKADDSWRMEWMPFDISPSDEQEIRDHLSKMLEAWLRVMGLPGKQPKSADRWPDALACLTGQEIALVEAMRETAAGLSYAEMIEVDGAFDDLAIPSNARTRVKRIRDSWKEHDVPFEIPSPRRGGKLKVVETISEKNVSDT